MGDRVALTPQATNRYGDGVTVTLTAASADNHTMINDGRTILLALNLNAATRDITVTGVASPRTGGDAKTQVHTAPAAVAGVPGVAAFGFFDPAAFNQASGVINIDASATADLHLAAVQISRTPA